MAQIEITVEPVQSAEDRESVLMKYADEVKTLQDQKERLEREEG